MHLPVDDSDVYICRCFCTFSHFSDASTYICFSNSVPAISPYLLYQSRFSGFRLPPPALTFLRNSVSYPSMRRATTVSAVSFSGGGSQSVRSITSSIVFRRCRVVGSYLKRTHTRSAPYFFVRFLVPRWPGLRIRRVFRSVSCWQCA